MTLLWEAFLFDMDGVLVDSAELHLRAYRRAFASEGLEFPPKVETRVRSGGARDVVLREALAVLELEPSRVTALYRTLHEKKGREFEAFLDDGELPLIEGAAELVAELAEHGYPLGVVTNSRAPKQVLAALGIADRFKVCVGREHVDEPKPDPAGYRHAARELGVDPKHTVAFEDTEDGVEAAIGAGMSVVGIGARSLQGTILQAPNLRDAELRRFLLGS